MKKLIFLFILSSTIFIGCKKKTVDNYSNEIILFQTSFEKNDTPDFSGWLTYYEVPQYNTAYVVPSTCPNGGLWALQIYAQHRSTTYIERYITNLSGKKHLVLSMYSKSLAVASLYLSLSQIRNNKEIKSKTFSNRAWNGWMNFNIEDTLDISTNDSLKINILTRGISYAPGWFNIDLIQLKEIKD